MNALKKELEHFGKRTQLRLFIEHYYFKNTSNSKKKIKIFLIPDIGEHCKRYEKLVIKLLEKFSKSKYCNECYCIDLPGHGRSEGKRGHIESLKSTTLDLIDVINNKVNEDESILFLGSGVGALIICDILHSEIMKVSPSIKAAILLDPAFKFKKKSFHFLEKLVYETTIADRLKVNYQVDDIGLENGSDEINDQDPLFCHKISLSTIWQIQSLGKSLRTSSYYLENPFFVGVNDSHPIYDEDLTELFCRGFENGHFQKYYHAPHYLEGENSKINALNDIIKWFQNEIV